jgi:hypothetical protein
MKEHKSTPEEIAEDKRLNKIFVAEFKKRFGKKLAIKISRFHKDNVLCDTVSTYASASNKPEAVGRIEYVQEPFIAIKNGIWPCGIREVKGKKIFGRTFTIDFEMKGRVRFKHYRYSTDDNILTKFYDYSETMEEVLNKFEDFLSTPLEQNKRFVRMSKGEAR